MQFSLYIPVVIICGSLSACGGTTQQNYVQLLDNGRSLYNDSIAQPLTDVSTLPTKGSATYDGFMRANIDIDGGLDVAGQVEINIDFASADPISGRIHNIADINDNAYEGELTLSDSYQDRGNDPAVFYTFGVDVDGELTDVNNNDVVVDAQLYGHFHGSGHDYIDGVIVGNATTDGNEVEIREGIFAAER